MILQSAFANAESHTDTDSSGELCKEMLLSNPKPKKTDAEDLLMSLMASKRMEDRQRVLSHGYVHGHIHVHDDHAHIHGHFHNHDHDSHYRKQTDLAANRMPKVTEGTSNNYLDSCQELDYYSFCDEVLCDDLDDCFFQNCDDNKKEPNVVYNDIQDANKMYMDNSDKVLSFNTAFAKKEVCEDPSCFSDAVIGNDQSCGLFEYPQIRDEKDVACCEGLYDHQDNLCALQLDKRPIFENLINEVQRSFECKNNEVVLTHDMKELAPKRQKQESGDGSGIQIHFPHECHSTIDNALLELKLAQDGNISASNHHHIHQSCFHTKISDFSHNDLAAKGSNGISDYDFYVQFDNFRELLNPANKSFNSGAPNPTSLYLGASFLESNPKDDAHFYPCLWNKCSQKVSDETVLKHLLDNHLDETYKDILGSDTTSVSPRVIQCEWNDCTYADSDMTSLIHHLDMHKYNSKSSQEGFDLITPKSTDISSNSSPNESTINISTPRPKLNITSMHVAPQYQRKQSSRASLEKCELICRWQMGLDEHGKPMQCGKCARTEGELHEHLLDDHIGLGKSIYNCCWVGCNRHNGKCFPQRQKLVRHIHIHTDYKPCRCHICNASFAVGSMLEQHLRTHSGEKPYACTICGKKFATASSLSIHNRVHTGEKPLVCKWPGCGKRFSESSNLTKHMKVHQKKYTCDACGCEFDKKINYTKHLKSHNNSKG